MKKNKLSLLTRTAVTALTVAGAGLATQALAGPPVNMTVEMDGGCPTQVNDASNSCPAGEGGPGKACAVKAGTPTPLHWTSSNGEPITIIFKGEPPAGVSQSNGGNSGNVNAVVSADAAEGSYSYGVQGPSCTLDPVIIVKS
jgi:hypothetical protein